MNDLAQPRRPGRPRKNPVMDREEKREPISGANLRGTPNWADIDPGTEATIDKFKVPQEFLEKWKDYDFQWITDTCAGQPDPHRRRQFEQTGWTPVHQESFDGDLRGLYMKKTSDEEINLGGMVLVTRPKQMSAKARTRDLRAAREQVAIKEQALRGGDIPVTLDSRHPSAVNTNRISKTMERIAVPED